MNVARRRRLVLFSLILLVMLAVSAAAFSQTVGGYLGGGELGVGVGVPGGSGTGGGTSGGSGTSGGGGGSGPQCTAGGVTGAETYRVATDAEAGSLDTAGPTVDNLNPGHGILVGRPDAAPTVNDPTPQRTQGTWYVKSCGGVQAGFVFAPVGTSPGPPPPPPPPTAAEVFDRIPLPAPVFGVSPRGDGLTGLATWLWDPNGAGGRTVTATIRGWTATATANPGTWTWTMYDPGEPGPASHSNPPATVSANHPGGENSPAATYTYETAGTYTLTLTVTWTGSYTYTRPGYNATTAPLGTSTRQVTRSYTVDAITPVVVAST